MNHIRCNIMEKILVRPVQINHIMKQDLHYWLGSCSALELGSSRMVIGEGAVQLA
jgi:hypothetical protein